MSEAPKAGRKPKQYPKGWPRCEVCGKAAPEEFEYAAIPATEAETARWKRLKSKWVESRDYEAGSALWSFKVENGVLVKSGYRATGQPRITGWYLFDGAVAICNQKCARDFIVRAVQSGFRLDVLGERDPQ